jgi:hypothetical protein
MRIAATAAAAPWPSWAEESEDGGKTWMRFTKPPTVLSMEERGRVPPGVGPAGEMSAADNLPTVGVLVIVAI